MADVEIELPEVHVQPGEIQLVRRPHILRTILGSCVSVTFWNSRIGIGALCHGVLPKCPAGVQAPEGFRYLDFAILELLRQIERLGAAPGELQIKVFGGGDVLPVRRSIPRKPTIGHLNCQAALDILRRESLKIAAFDLGGNSGRVIQFHTDTGDVFLKRLSTWDSQQRKLLAELAS